MHFQLNYHFFEKACITTAVNENFAGRFLHYQTTFSYTTISKTPSETNPNADQSVFVSRDNINKAGVTRKCNCNGTHGGEARQHIVKITKYPRIGAISMK